MANFLAVFLLFTTTVALTATTNNLLHFTADPPSPPPLLAPSPPPPLLPPPPPPPSEDDQQEQLNNIINALIGAGDFAQWVSIILNPNPNSSTTTGTATTPIPTTATLFIPGNDAISHLTTSATGALSLDPFIIPYHILPQRLSFSDLQLFKIHTRLPTLLPSKTILITNNTPSNFTIDDSLITHPDIYLTSALSLHGIATVLDYTTYGNAGSSSIPPPVNSADTNQTSPQETPDNPNSRSTSRSRSASLQPSSGANFLIVLVSCFLMMR